MAAARDIPSTVCGAVLSVYGDIENPMVLSCGHTMDIKDIASSDGRCETCHVTCISGQVDAVGRAMLEAAEAGDEEGVKEYLKDAVTLDRMSNPYCLVPCAHRVDRCVITRLRTPLSCPICRAEVEDFTPDPLWTQIIKTAFRPALVKGLEGDGWDTDPPPQWEKVMSLTFDEEMLPHIFCEVILGKLKSGLYCFHGTPRSTKTLVATRYLEKSKVDETVYCSLTKNIVTYEKGDVKKLVARLMSECNMPSEIKATLDELVAEL